MMFTRVVQYHIGKAGPNGADGQDGVGVDEFSLGVVNNSLMRAFNNSALLTKGYGPLVWDRMASSSRPAESIVTDNYGNASYNYQTDNINYITEPLNGATWLFNNSFLTLDSTSVSDPDGGTNANRYTTTQSTQGATDIIAFPCANQNTITNDGNPLSSCFVVSVYVRSETGIVNSLDISVAGITYTVGQTVSSNWTRFDVFVDDFAGSLINITPRAASGVTFDVAFPQYERSLTLTDFHTGSVERQKISVKRTDGGYKFDRDSINVVKNSLDLAKWIVADGAISEVSDSPIGGKFRCALSALSGAPPTLTGDLTSIEDGAEYTVSFYAKIFSGGMSNFQISVGEGSPVVAQTQPIAFDWTRIVVSATASFVSTISIQALNPVGGLSVGIWGVQVEKGSLSDFFASNNNQGEIYGTFAQAGFRNNIPATDKPFAIRWEQKNLSAGGTQHVYYCDPNLMLRYDGADLVYVSGSDTVTATDAINAKDVALVYDGANYEVYLEKALYLTVPSTQPFSGLAEFLRFGGALESTLSAVINDFETYTVPLTEQQIRSL